MLLIRTRIGPSEIHGIGVFADELVPEGTPVWRFEDGYDLRFPGDFPDRLPEPARERFLHYSYRTADREYEFCSDDARFFNHSDSPNTASILRSGVPVDVALRDIQPGEELTCDYRSFDLDWERKLRDLEVASKGRG